MNLCWFAASATNCRQAFQALWATPDFEWVYFLEEPSKINLRSLECRLQRFARSAIPRGQEMHGNSQFHGQRYSGIWKSQTGSPRYEKKEKGHALRVPFFFVDRPPESERQA
jgi:hypothetical protein